MKRASVSALVIFILTMSFASFQKVNAMIIDDTTTGAIGVTQQALQKSSGGMLGGDISKINKEIQSSLATLRSAVRDAKSERNVSRKNDKTKKAEAIYKVSPIVIKAKINLAICRKTQAQLKKRYANITSKLQIQKRKNIAVPPAVTAKLDQISQNITIANAAVTQASAYVNQVTPEAYLRNPTAVVESLKLISTGVKNCKTYLIRGYDDVIAIPQEYQPS